MEFLTQAHSWIDTSLLAGIFIYIGGVAKTLENHEARLVEIERKI